MPKLVQHVPLKDIVTITFQNGESIRIEYRGEITAFKHWLRKHVDRYNTMATSGQGKNDNCD